MLGHILSFQFGGFYGGEIGNLLASWEQAGVFSYVLPFLLIFAIVFGVLSKIKIFGENRALNAVIALVIGLLALQFDMVPIFFSEIFPRLGVALSILLVLIVLAGLFFDTSENKVLNYLLLGVAVIIFLTILVKTSGQLGWYSGYWWYANWKGIVGAAVIIGALVAIISSGGKRPVAPELKMHWPGK
ncbi:MAG: hypothetical protein NTW17_02535 [Candidatus Pacearchaeota archaeon]|nr:hypothetical protein [Candidatus Pacearchaeota archaeon]